MGPCRRETRAQASSPPLASAVPSLTLGRMTNKAHEHPYGSSVVPPDHNATNGNGPPIHFPGTQAIPLRDGTYDATMRMNGRPAGSDQSVIPGVRGVAGPAIRPITYVDDQLLTSSEIAKINSPSPTKQPSEIALFVDGFIEQLAEKAAERVATRVVEIFADHMELMEAAQDLVAQRRAERAQGKPVTATSEDLVPLNFDELMVKMDAYTKAAPAPLPPQGPLVGAAPPQAAHSYADVEKAAHEEICRVLVGYKGVRLARLPPAVPALYVDGFNQDGHSGEITINVDPASVYRALERGLNEHCIGQSPDLRYIVLARGQQWYGLRSFGAVIDAIATLAGGGKPCDCWIQQAWMAAWNGGDGEESRHAPSCFRPTFAGNQPLVSAIDTSY